MECKLMHHYPIMNDEGKETADVFIGRVLVWHIRKEVLKDDLTTDLSGIHSFFILFYSLLSFFFFFFSVFDFRFSFFAFRFLIFDFRFSFFAFFHSLLPFFLLIPCFLTLFSSSLLLFISFSNTSYQC